MYLTKTLDGFIEDHENGRTYVLSESIPDYDNNTVATTVYVRSWFGDSIKLVDLAHELDAIKLWDHLTSLCKLNTVDASKPNATKAQDAPNETDWIAQLPPPTDPDAIPF